MNECHRCGDDADLGAMDQHGIMRDVCRDCFETHHGLQEADECRRLGKPLVVFPLTALVLFVGNVTGHYQGFYAQSQSALYLQVGMIVALAAAMLVQAIRWDRDGVVS